MNVQIDIHKRFINCEHAEFAKMTQIMKKSKEYIQRKNHFNLWFKERVSTAEKNNTYKDDSEDFYDSDNGTEVMIDKVVDFAA